jgi:hypothetical protein
MGGIAWSLVGLEHPICPPVSCRQGEGEVGIEQSTFAAVGIGDRRIVDVHELGTAGNRASEYVWSTYGWDRNSGTACYSTVGIFKVETADGAVQVWSAVAVIQVERSGQPDRLQGLSFVRRV